MSLLTESRERCHGSPLVAHFIKPGRFQNPGSMTDRYLGKGRTLFIDIDEQVCGAAKRTKYWGCPQPAYEYVSALTMHEVLINLESPKLAGHNEPGVW